MAKTFDRLEQAGLLIGEAKRRLSEAPVSPLNDATTVAVEALDQLHTELEELRKAFFVGANTASCLANGMKPD